MAASANMTVAPTKLAEALPVNEVVPGRDGLVGLPLAPPAPPAPPDDPPLVPLVPLLPEVLRTKLAQLRRVAFLVCTTMERLPKKEPTPAFVER